MVMLKALRLLLLLVLSLTAAGYLFGFILNASPLRAYLYTPVYLAMQPMLRSAQNVSTPTSMLITKIPDGMKNAREDVTKSDSAPVILPMCESMSDLGPVRANRTHMELDDVQSKFPDVQWRGWYAPANCTAEHKVAIIVPYRDRKRHLAIFLNHMHPFLMKQQIEYGIYIVEQKGKKRFNRAKLMNVGFMESQKLQPHVQCFIFHDIDLLPLDTRNLYSCTRQPRHMAASIDKFNFKLLFKGHTFGGVSAMTLEQMQKVDGFSNQYWGWGGEDDDMYFRLIKHNYHIARYKMTIARYTALKHMKSTPNPNRFKLLRQNKTDRDGLSTLRYEIVKVMQYDLYTHILANIDEDHTINMDSTGTTK